MKLSDIIKNCGVSAVEGPSGIEITSVTNDSRKACPGCLFIAVNGCGNDGRAYIAQALEKGAAAVMYEAIPDQVGNDVTKVIVEDSRKAVALAADAFYGHPSGKLKLVGITGTNGKTTTVTLLYRMFRSMGYECGLLSTIANYVGSERTETANTTSDPVTINSLLAKMVDAGCEYCFMEVSSIGVEQERVTGLEFRVGIFSNQDYTHITEWYTFDEVRTATGMRTESISDFLREHKIPKMKKNNITYISKVHWDEARGLNVEKDLYYTMAEITDKYGLSRNHLYCVFKEHKVPRIKRGNFVYFIREDVDNILANRKNS